MGTASFPATHRCLPPSGDGCANPSLSRLIFPLSNSSNPSSRSSLPSFGFGNIFKIVAYQSSRRGFGIQVLRLKSLGVPCEASIGRIGSPGKSSLNGYNVSAILGTECGMDELETKEALIDHEEEQPSSRKNSGTHNSVEVGNAGSYPYLVEKESGIKLRYLEERDEEVLSKQILELSRSNKMISALELFWSMKIFKLKPNLHACNSLLSCLLRNGMLDDALGVFEYMKNERITSGHSFSLVFKAFARIRGSDEAVKMFMELVSKSEIEKDFDTIVYNTIISVCSKANDWFHMERVWHIMIENGHVGTAVTYNILICSFVRSGRYELSIAAYNEMLQHGIKPDVDSMHAMIGACAKEGKWDLALIVYQTMLDNGLKPNLVACNALINLLGKAGKVEIAFRVYNQMNLFGHTPDAHTCNALLGALYTANRYTDALQLFHRIRTEQRLQLNIELYNTALICCQRLRLWDKSLQLLWLMELSGLSVTTASYNLVIGTCEAARKPKVALQVFEHMIYQKCPADTFTHLSLARSCIWGSLWIEVEKILDLTSDASIYNTVVQGMCLRGKVEKAKQLYTKMREMGLVPDGKTRALMLQHLLKDSS